jgi:hypothetical protein
MSRGKLFSRTSRIVALCSIANFINAADRIIMPIAIVPMTDKFHWNLNFQGWILSSFACGYFTSQVCSCFLRCVKVDILELHIFPQELLWSPIIVSDNWSMCSSKVWRESRALFCCFLVVCVYGYHTFMCWFDSDIDNLQAASWTRRRLR